jgi:hypothetical protein
MGEERVSESQAAYKCQSLREDAGPAREKGIEGQEEGKKRQLNKRRKRLHSDLFWGGSDLGCFVDLMVNAEADITQ